MGTPSTACNLAFSAAFPLSPSPVHWPTAQKRQRHIIHRSNQLWTRTPSAPVLSTVPLRHQLNSQLDNAQTGGNVSRTTSTISPHSPSAASHIPNSITASSDSTNVTVPGTTSGPNCRRSKLVLTRRVFSWTLRRRLARHVKSPPSPPPTSPTLASTALDSAPPSPPPVQTLLGQRFPANATPIESMLSPNEPVATFVFHRGYTPIIKRRRSGDPPNRYLRLSYGLVEPFSSSAYHCSNPRATGSLKSWYQAAARWNVLEADYRPPLVLKPSQRVYDDGAKVKPFDYSSSASTLENSSPSTSFLSTDIASNTTSDGQINGSSQILNQTISAASAGVASPLSANGVNKNDDHLWDKDAGVPISPLLSKSRWERSLGRSPRIIAIGDVHGCIDELQQLLRLADYQPGDQVILLGDLVAKGPDSAGVVQLAREIGARSVRGNHDFEVVRWWEARKSGNADSIVSAEHARIARTLSEADHAWLLDCPWFIECSEMDHLFVHAGFIPGVKLTQQNPRLMMNMRSVLRDGTVTAKNVEHCEWAKLWQGPQTVVFGHDAVRGLQEHQYARGIDTGCVYGGRLTALLLPENRLISVAAKRAYIQPKRYRLVS